MAEPITLNFFNRGGQFIENVMDQQMSLYREANPNIEFEINAVAGASHQEALLIMISAGTGPDMWFDANRTTGPLTRKGVTTNLEPYFEADPDFNEDDYVENVWIAQTYDGARWGHPLGQWARCSWRFNIDSFDEVGVPPSCARSVDDMGRNYRTRQGSHRPTWMAIQPTIPISIRPG